MSNQRLPPGWAQERIRKLASHQDPQTQDEQEKEIESALSAKDLTLIAVPTKLVPEIQALVFRRRGA